MTCQGKLDICLDHLSFKDKIMVHLWYVNTIEDVFHAFLLVTVEWTMPKDILDMIVDELSCLPLIPFLSISIIGSD